MQKLIVSSQRVTGPSADGIIVTAFKTFVETENGMYDLCNYFDFQELDDIEIISQKSFFSVRLNIPPELKKAIIDFLLTQHIHKDDKFDCYSFVNKYHNVEEHKKSYLMNYWKLKKLVFLPKVGDVVFFLDTSRQLFRHASIYVGWGVYVSVYGAGGDIHFATLKDMKNSFGGENIFLATPRL